VTYQEVNNGPNTPELFPVGAAAIPASVINELCWAETREIGSGVQEMFQARVQKNPFGTGGNIIAINFNVKQTRRIFLPPRHFRVIMKK